jgi:outer membrane autotransporter protein
MIGTQSIEGRLAVCAVLAVLFFTPSSSRGSITTTGDIYPSQYPGLGNWSLGGSSLRIGDVNDGTLLITAGYQVHVTNDTAYFGYGSLAEGVGTVSGTGSLLDAAYGVVVGTGGVGILDVNNAGQVTDTYALLGMLAGSTGTARLTDAGTVWDSSGALGVGAWGTGNLTIANGAAVNAADVYIGGVPIELLGGSDPNLRPNGTGIVTVSGAGSQLQATGSGALYVGFYGNGTLDVNEGGQVSAESAVIGVAPGVNGVAAVHDTDSYLSVNTDLLVGAWGRGELTVAEGGVVEAGILTLGGFDVNDTDLDPNIVAAYGDPEGTGVVTVTGLNSYLGAGDIVVGYTGTGTLNIRDAGYAETGFGVVGFLPGSHGQVLVDGNDSTWLTDTTVVGMYSQGFLTISNGGYVTDVDSYVGGFDPCAVGLEYLNQYGEPNGTGTVLVTGADSTWGNAGTLYLGYAGDGQMTVQAGGTVQDELAILGFTPDSIGQAYVTGQNSTWQHNQDLVLGAWGIGTLSVTAGGTVENQNAYVGGFDPADFGYDAGTFGPAQGTGAVLVSGAGSLWTNTGDLLVGYYGTGTVDVNDGGHVTSLNGYIGYEEGSQGTVRVADTGSIWDVTNDLYVGGDTLSAGSGLLSVRDGGLVTVGGALWVQPAGTLMGNGVIDAPLVDNYGTIAPGNSIGTLTVNGDVTFEPNSVLEVEVSADDTSDKLLATGNVNILGGTVKPVSAGTIVGSHQYEIVEADSVTGTFDALDTALLNFYFNDVGLDYDPNSVWLWVDATRFDDPNIWRTNNEREVGEALQQIAEGGGTEVTDALQQLDDFNDIRHAYDQLAGQSRPPLAPVTVSATSKFFGTVTGRVQTLQTGLYAMSDSSLFAMSGPESGMDGGRVGATPRRGQTLAVGRGSPTLSDRKWGVWGQGYGLFGDRETEEAGVPGYTYNMYGGSLGVDYQLTETFLLGLVGGYSTGEVQFSGLRDNADITATYFGAYGSLAWEKYYVDAVAGYVGLKYDTERFVDLLSERLTGSFDGTEVTAYVEAGYNWDLAPNLHLQPLVSLQYTYLSLDSYTESGGASALAFDDQTYNSIKASLGARLTQTLVETARDFRADLQLRGRWVHEFGDNQSTVDATFVNSPAAVFTVEDESISRDSAVLGAGLHTDLNRQMRVYLDYDIRLNSDESVNVFSAALQYRW